ncbi:hypothetical protein [Ferrovibrio terrae]|uniref:hypothetical protein n=1 Tax=Ferrovibrio terrae TaxID=2594003 RepID=UPI0031381841
MKQTKTARRNAAALRSVAIKTAALGVTSAQVVGRRLALVATGDHAEVSRMVPEKLGAATVSGMAVMQHTMLMSMRLAGFAVAEAFRMARVAGVMSDARTPAAVFGAQVDFMQAWLPRWQSQAMLMGGAWTRSGSAMLAPVQRVAAANARRLGRS